jgi:pyrimidine-specific ribonucleoside hydrolase
MKALQTPPIHLIWDDDGSPDGVIALLYFLRHPDVSVDAITVSHGQAHTSLFAHLLPRMLARLGRAGIPVAAGRASPLVGNNNFPEPWRTPTDTFWGISLPEQGEPLYPRPAADLITKVLSESANPVSLFVTGAHTNLAEALRMAPEIKKGIAAVHVMGGALYVSGNIESEWPEIHNKVAEWNIWADSFAASETFNAGLPLHLTPLDATDRVTWTREDVDAWKASGLPEGVLAAEILERMLELSKAESVYLWDLLTAIHMTDPDLCQMEKIHVQVVAQPGDEEGRTVVVADQPANANVYLKPQAAAVRVQASRVFGSP